MCTHTLRNTTIAILKIAITNCHWGGVRPLLNAKNNSTHTHKNTHVHVDTQREIRGLSLSSSLPSDSIATL